MNLYNAIYGFIAMIFLLVMSLSSAAAQSSTAVAANLTEQDKTDLKQVETYLESITTLQSKFLQVSSNGGVASGNFFMSRPGKIRFEYDPPESILMVADGLFLVYIDKDLEQTTHVLLKSTPAYFLVREDIQLSGDITVTRVERSPGILRLTVQDTDEPEKGSLTLTLTTQPLTLRKWTVIDAKNIKTEITLTNQETGMILDPSLFEYNP